MSFNSLLRQRSRLSRIPVFKVNRSVKRCTTNSTKLTFTAPQFTFMIRVNISLLPQSDLFLPAHCRCGRLLIHLNTCNDTHTHTHTYIHTFRSSPLDEGSACRRDLYTTTSMRQPCPVGIRTSKPSKWAPADPHERVHTIQTLECSLAGRWQSAR